MKIFLFMLCAPFNDASILALLPKNKTESDYFYTLNCASSLSLRPSVPVQAECARKPLSSILNLFAIHSSSFFLSRFVDGYLAVIISET